MDETKVETFLFFRFFISSQQWPYFNFYHHSNIPNLWEWLEPSIKSFKYYYQNEYLHSTSASTDGKLCRFIIKSFQSMSAYLNLHTRMVFWYESWKIWLCMQGFVRHTHF